LKQSYSCTDAADATLAQRVVSSLIRAVNDPDCEMERPWDWISTDPDFACLRRSRIFRDFLANQKAQDYPADRAVPPRADHQGGRGPLDGRRSDRHRDLGRAQGSDVRTPVDR